MRDTLAGPTRLRRARMATAKQVSPQVGQDSSSAPQSQPRPRKNNDSDPQGLDRSSPRPLVQPRQQPPIPQAPPAPTPGTQSSLQPSPSVLVDPPNQPATAQTPDSQTLGNQPAAPSSLPTTAGVGTTPGTPLTPGGTTMAASSSSASSISFLVGSETITGGVSNSTSSSLASSGSWSASPQPSSTSSASAESETTFVPGVVLDLHFAGTSDTQAVYSVPMTFGHDDEDGYRRKRGGGTQVLNMLVDLGSADMWAAIKDCKTSDCKAASNLFDNDESMTPDVSVPMSLSYVAGSVSGEINWEKITLGPFGIGHQAFLAADNVYNEDLAGGEFQGLLGLALPSSSNIQKVIHGTETSNPDGATFLDNLFGAGRSAPSQRMFSLSLERREDSRTISSLAIGAVDERLCPLPCSPDFIPIVPERYVGTLGSQHWRVPLLGFKAYKFANAAEGTGVTSVTIPLGESIVEPGRKNPLAVLDSGGVQILVNSKSVADAIYGAYGISARADGLYRMPCNQQLSFSLLIGNEEYPVHPLDMTWPDPDDESRQSCIGAIQVSHNLGNFGDFILGSTFLKNVYSIYKYPEQKDARNWQPTVGMKSTTNMSTASADFYAVRNYRLSLATVSAHGPGGANPSPPISGAIANAAQQRAASTAIIAACSVVGFFVLAAGSFCAWWFILRRKIGDDGVVEYKMAMANEEDPEEGAGRHRSANSVSTMRSKKHEETQRQRSMVEGFSDFDDDHSVALSNLQAVIDEDNRRIRAASGLSGHTRGSSLHTSLLAADNGSPTTPMSDFFPRDRRSSADTNGFLMQPQDRSLCTNNSQGRRISWDSRTIDSRAEFPRSMSMSSSRLQISSPSSTARLIEMQGDTPPTSPPASRSFPALSTTVSHSSTLSMSGPFPGARQSLTSDLDYFPVLSTPDGTDRERRASNNNALSFPR